MGWCFTWRFNAAQPSPCGMAKRRKNRSFCALHNVRLFQFIYYSNAKPFDLGPISCLRSFFVFYSQSRRLIPYLSAMTGPVITDLPSSKVNATHWKWVYRCQNCVCKWLGLFNSPSSPILSSICSLVHRFRNTVPPYWREWRASLGLF